MNANREEIYSYSYLFGVTLVFSALASEIFLLYLLARGSILVIFEPLIVGIMLCILFSVLGGRLSKVNGIRKWISSVSAFSCTLYYGIFFVPTILTNSLIQYIGYGVPASLTIGYFSWDFLDIGWEYMSQRKIARKTIAIAVGISILGILFVSFASVYSTELISFFDSHPWAMTLIGVLATLFGGILIGRRTKKS